MKLSMRSWLRYETPNDQGQRRTIDYLIMVLAILFAPVILVRLILGN